jgi:putative ATPase
MKNLFKNNTDESGAPLAERMRPQVLNDIVGQDDLLGPGRPLRQLIESDNLPSLLFWGPPGCGKTSLARVIAHHSSARFLEYSAVQVGSKELKAVMAEAAKIKQALGQRTIIFLDEIHRFNKAQQDALLPPVEKGDVILIGATTENPSFEINSALLSRTRLFVLNQLQQEDVTRLLGSAVTADRGLAGSGVSFTDEALQALAVLGDGDARMSLSLLEMTAGAVTPDQGAVTAEAIEDMVQDRTLRYDRAGEEHYNIISALHKSLRNSDPDAALYYLARMLEGGEDPLFIARRLVRAASEDIGLADPQALPQAIAARDAVQFIGMPECELALAQAVAYLSLAPKSNALYTGYKKVGKEVRKGINPPVPLHLRNAPTSMMKKLGYGDGYEYAHDTEEGVTPMTCLPDSLKDAQFYKPTNRGMESRYRERLTKIREWRKERADGDNKQKGES